MEKIKHWIPLFVIIVLMAIAYFSGLSHYLSFEQLKLHRQEVIVFVSSHWIQASLLFILLYAVVAALSLPVEIFLSVAGGFLFPQPFSTLYIVIGATIGATLVFLAAKTAFAPILKKKTGGFLKKIEAGFKKHGASYLLFLRLIPLFPFWLVNLAPAFLNVSLRTFVWTTFVGIIPGSFVFAEAGAGLGAILDSNQPFSLTSIFDPKVKIALEVKIAVIALVLFAIISIIVLKMAKKKTKKNAR